MKLDAAQSGQLHYEFQALKNALTGPKGLRIYLTAKYHCCYRNSLFGPPFHGGPSFSN